MKSDIYKEFYQFEWDHRSHLTSALNIPIAAATIVGGGIAFMAQSFSYSGDINTKLFVALTCLSSSFLLGVLFFIFKAFHGYTYSRIPTPLKFKKHYDELLDWHEKYAEGKKSADIRFEEYFNMRVGEAAEVNSHNNKNRSAYLYRTNVSLALSLFFLIISSAPYLYSKINETEKTYSVNVVQPITFIPKEIKMPEPEENAKQNTPEPTPPEPTPPSNENIKEYTVDKESTVIIEQREE